MEYEYEIMIEIRESKVHGKGVFATRDIKKGETIGHYIGDVINEKQYYKLKSKRYVYYLCENYYIDAQKNKSCNMRYLNHSSNASVEPIISTRWKTIRFETIKKIKKGEEILLDYGDIFWQGNEHKIR